MLISKASELASEVRSLGASLLSASEKYDAEKLALLRVKHEKAMLTLGESIRYAQWQESIKAREGLERSFSGAVDRYRYYERLLGVDEKDIRIPELDALDPDALERMKLKTGEPEVSRRAVEVDVAEGSSGGRVMSSYEKKQMELLAIAQAFQDAAAHADVTGSALSIIPQFGAEFAFWGVGGNSRFGGQQLHSMHSGLASSFRGIAGRVVHQAQQAQMIGGFAEREREWAFQSNNSANEISQIFKQLRAAQIREAIAEKEWRNHQRQIEFAEEIDHFLSDENSGKKTGQGLYAWMMREIRGLHTSFYDLAMEVAGKAEQAMRHELGDPKISYIKHDHLKGKEGLLAGEKLLLEIKRMEIDYFDLNKREYELTKHISLLQLDPRQLLKLRETGACEFKIPEVLFDLDCPGHFFRRIRSVALSIPSVTGAFTSLNCKLTLTESRTRISSKSKDKGAYPDKGEDERFIQMFGGGEAIVTSSARNDTGLFDSNRSEDRYLPFERAGAVSTWKLELPASQSGDLSLEQFDYQTISDVALTMEYTARDGGDALSGVVRAYLDDLLAEENKLPMARLFSVADDFPLAWSEFSREGSPGKISVEIEKKHYPFWWQGLLAKGKVEIEILMKPKSSSGAPSKVYFADPDTGAKIEVTANKGEDAIDNLIQFKGKDVNKLLNSGPVGLLSFGLDGKGVSGMWILLRLRNGILPEPK